MTIDVTDDIFADIEAGLGQALTHAQGETTSGLVVHVPEMLNVAAIRQRTGHSQPAFAGSIGVKLSTLRQWEHGRRQPQGPARVLLAMLDRDPDLVRRMLERPAR